MGPLFKASPSSFHFFRGFFRGGGISRGVTSKNVRIKRSRSCVTIPASLKPPRFRLPGKGGNWEVVHAMSLKMEGTVVKTHR